MLLCVVAYSTAQSFSSLKKTAASEYNNDLAELLNKNDEKSLAEYLRKNPAKVNDATSTKQVGDMRTVKPVPLVYDAIDRTLNGKLSVGICQIIIDAGCNMNAPFNEKTPVYIVLDFIATHSRNECDVAEQILALILARSDFDVNWRYQSLLPPFSYLIRENHNYLNKFSADYISDNVIKMFIEKGAPVNTYDNEGNSLIAFALETENDFLQTYFIDNGINTMKKNKDGRDALYIAVESGNLSLVKKIITSGYDLNINNLQNDPIQMKKYPDIYDYIAELCASKETEYDSLIFFVDKFPDKLLLVKERLDKIYYNDYARTELARQKIIQYLDGDVSYIDMASLADEAKAFIKKFVKYDIENKRIFAQEVVDFESVMSGVKLRVLDTYILYSGGWSKFFDEEILESPGIRILINQARAEESTLNNAMSIVNRFSFDNIFPQRKVITIFDQIYDELRDKMDKLTQIANRDIKIYNEYITAFNEKLSRDRFVRCINCEIDEPQTRFPHSESESNHYTEQEPGFFVMKNGDKQEFYYSDGKWITLSGFIFRVETEFDTLNELAKEFLLQCKARHCR